jgi:sugar phosphate isomerase/epimerase
MNNMRQRRQLSRRQFLQRAASTTLAMGAGSLALGHRAFGAGKDLILACRDAHLKASGQPDCWAAMKELGLQGVEVSVTDDLLCPGLYHAERKYSLATDDGVKLVRDDFAAHGMVITSFCMGNRLDERLEQEVTWMRNLLKAAGALKVNAIRIDVVPRKAPADQFLGVAVKACKQLCELADGAGVRLGIENHGRVTNDPQFLEKLFDGVGSAGLGLTLDAMNFYWFGHPLNDVYGICERFAARVVHTHCKNLRYPDDKKNERRPIGFEYEKHAAPVYDGDIDFRRVVQILRKANYQGDLCLENECLRKFPADQHLTVLKKELALLKGLRSA